MTYENRTDADRCAWREHDLEKLSAEQFDAAVIARELLTILHEVHGYAGLPKLKVTTEQRRRRATAAAPPRDRPRAACVAS